MLLGANRSTLLRVLDALAREPNLSVKSLAIILFGERRNRSAERSRIHRMIGVLFEIGLVVETGSEAAGSGAVFARRYSLAPGFSSAVVDLAIGEKITLWEALLRSNAVAQTG